MAQSVGCACWRLIAGCHGLGALDAHPFSQDWQTAQIRRSPHPICRIPNDRRVSPIAFMLAMSLFLTWVDVGRFLREFPQLVFRSAGWCAHNLLDCIILLRFPSLNRFQITLTTLLAVGSCICTPKIYNQYMKMCLISSSVLVCLYYIFFSKLYQPLFFLCVAAHNYIDTSLAIKKHNLCERCAVRHVGGWCSQIRYVHMPSKPNKICINVPQLKPSQRGLSVIFRPKEVAESTDIRR